MLNSPEVHIKPKPNETTNLLRKFNDILYLCGLRNFWMEPEKFSKTFTARFDVASIILHLIQCGYTILLLTGFLTQNNLTKKQQADIVVNLANPLSHFYCLVFLYHRSLVRQILYRLMVVLKEQQNDELAEKEMIRKLKVYLVAYIGSGLWMLIVFAVYGIYKKIRSGLPFVTIVTAWPDVLEDSTTAEVARVVFYGFWWVSFLRVSGSYIIILTMLIGMSKQYKNLQCYFQGLDKVFGEKLRQYEKEKKYETRFIKGVRMHSETIWCLNQIKHVCRAVFDAQMLLAVLTFVTMLPVLMNHKGDPESALANMPTVVLVLTTTGFFMWNAGDISVEASMLPDAIYGSGWQNCCLHSIRIRKLVSIAMTQAQKPVVLKALGAFELSYNGYLCIIRTSHSVFSVFY